MSTPVLNNGLFLRDNNWQITSHVDQAHLVELLKDAKPTDLGPVDLWAMGQKVEMPLYQMSSFGGNNVIMVDDEFGRWKWETPIEDDLPYIVEDIEPTNVTKGIAETSFKIKLSRREFGHGDIISYDKMNGVELVVDDTEEILPVGDGFIYTVKLMNNDSYKFLDNKFLKPGTQFLRKGSVIGEYGEKYSDISVRNGVREFYNYVGNGEAQVHYTVSSRAALIAKKGLNADGTLPVVELWHNYDKSIDPSIQSLDQLVVQKGQSYVKKMLANGDLTRSFLTKLEAAHLTKIAYDIETYLMWGHGGRVTTDGADDVRMTVGLWKQLDSSFKRIYNKSSFSLEMFRSEIYNFYNGRVEFKGPDPHREIVVQTGLGGMKMVNEAIKKEAASENFGNMMSYNGDKSGLGIITGSNAMNLGFGYSFTSYVIPFLANVKFVLNPAFDNVHTNDIENPIIDGFPLSSYSFIIFDITDNTQDNIYLLKLAYDNQLKWRYINGTMDYKGSTTGFQSSGNFSGFKVYMTQRYPAIWVKDPTKVLKIVMRNPITGGSF